MVPLSNKVKSNFVDALDISSAVNFCRISSINRVKKLRLKNGVDSRDILKRGYGEVEKPSYV